MNTAKIQIQDISGNWFTISTVKHTDIIVSNALDNATKSYKKRARAITPSGSVIDIRG